MRGNFVGVPTDCPQRDERLGWTGDLNAFARTATYLYDVRSVLGSWLDDLAVEQHAAGAVPWIVPDVLGTPSAPTALWSDVAVSLPWELYQEYGDLWILARAYPSMTAFMRQVEASLDERGLWSSGFQFGDWLDPDAPADNPAGGKTDRFLVACAYLFKTTRELAATAALLEETEDAAHYSALAERVRDAFLGEFVSPHGRVVNETATGYALALMFDILDGPQRQVAGRRLAEIVGAAGYTISTGLAGTPMVTDALSSTGHLEQAYLLLLQQRSPSFLYPVLAGATTIWERWDAVLPDGTLNSTGMTSLNHYALGAVSSWLHRVVGGLERLAPGWERIRIAPQPGGGLTSASTTHDTVLGRASSAWRAENGEMLLEVVVPLGATASVELPLHPDGSIVEVGPGDHSWSYPLPDGYGEPKVHTLETPLREITADPPVWAAVLDVLKSRLPGVPIEAAGHEMAEQSLSTVLQYFTNADERFERELVEALGGGAA